MTLTELIDNATEACKRDGYDQIIYYDSDLGYVFGRNYPIRDHKKIRVVGFIIGTWENGCYNTKTEYAKTN